MPSKDEHLLKAEGNRRFAYALRPANPVVSGWAITVLFYSALHYVEAYNAKYNCHFGTHDDLKRDISRNPQLSAIYDDYSDLLNFSWNARYRSVVYGEAELNEAKEYHEAVQKHISNLLGL